MLKDTADRLPGLALRLPGVVGPGAHRNWLSSVAAKLVRGETIGAFHLDQPFNNAAHVADICRAGVPCRRAAIDRVRCGCARCPWRLTVREALTRLGRGSRRARAA